MKKVVLLFISLLSFNTIAGQCNKLNTKQANKAKEIIENAMESSELFVVDRYCESCLDNYPKPIVVDEFSIEKEGSASQLSINDKVEDIAYIFVNGVNLATMVGCKTIAVSQYID